jgi:hypothetical protein
MSTVSSRSQGKKPSVPPPPPPPPRQQDIEEDSDELEELEEMAGPSTSPPIVVEARSDYNKAKINPPEVFKGERGKLKTFITQCNLYIYFNEGEFPNEERKIMFIVSYLRGTAYAWIEDRLGNYLIRGKDSPHRRLFNSINHFYDDFRMVFGDVDEKRTAERELKALKQKTSAADYSAHFQRISAHLAWGDEALLATYYDGLKDLVKDEIIRKENQPTTLSAMIEASIKIDNRLFERQLQKKGGSYRINQNQSNQSKKRHDPYGPQPMELDRIQAAPRNFKKKDGKCFNCGKPGHYANKCRYPKKQNISRIKVKGPTVQLAMIRAGPSKETENTNKEESEEEDDLIDLTDTVTTGGRTRFHPNRDTRERRRKAQWDTTPSLPHREKGVAFISDKGIEEMIFGPNQIVRNLSAISKLLRDNPTVVWNSDHSTHWILPMNLCNVTRCKLWEHKQVRDPGDPSWDFHPDHPDRLLNTQIRRVLLIPRVRSNTHHVHHKHLPRSECRAHDCTHFQHRHPELENFITNELEELDSTSSEPEDYPSAPGELKEYPSVSEQESDCSSDSAESVEPIESATRIKEFASDISKCINDMHPDHDGILPERCIDFTCRTHPNGRRNLRRLRKHLDAAVDFISANEPEDESEKEEDQQ